MTTRVRTRSRTARPAAAALVRDLAAPRPAGGEPELVLEARTAYDFLVSLVSDTEMEILPADRAWLDESRASLSEGLRRDVRRVFAHEEGAGVGHGLIPLVVADPAVRTAADVVALAGRIGALDLVRSSCDIEDIPVATPLAERALDGDRQALDELVGLWPEHGRDSLVRLVSDPEGELRAIRRVLRAWRERFDRIEAHIARMIERDLVDRKREAAELPLVALIERVTGGLRVVPEPSVRRVILAPSYFARPYNYLFGEQDWRLYCYPLAESALDGDPSGIPGATIRLFKALGDESRLRILRLLVDGDLYLTEIAERVELSKPTVKHHLALLRAAGLVTVTEEGGLTYYTLRRDRIADASPELQRLLGV